MMAVNFIAVSSLLAIAALCQLACATPVQVGSHFPHGVKVGFANATCDESSAGLVAFDESSNSAYVCLKTEPPTWGKLVTAGDETAVQDIANSMFCNGHGSFRAADRRCLCDAPYSGDSCSLLGEDPGSAALDCVEILDFDLANNLSRLPGVFWVRGDGTESIATYCDADGWALVRSFSLSNNVAGGYRFNGFTADMPRNAHDPENFMDFSMSQSDMYALRDSSHQFRVTCNMDTSLDRDYLLLSLSNLDPFSLNANGQCFQTIDINIRGHPCPYCYMRAWQTSNNHFHIDASISNGGSCTCGTTPCTNGIPDSVTSEDTFGIYGAVNSAFSCSATADSTTNYWVRRVKHVGDDAGTAPTSCAGVKSYDDTNGLDRQPGVFWVKPSSANAFPAYCNDGWTMAYSFSLANNDAHSDYPLNGNDYPRNDYVPDGNFDDYRLPHTKILDLRDATSEWMITCNMDMSETTDYVRVATSNLDPYTFSGSGQCRLVEGINIRGVGCTNCNARFWGTTTAAFHTDTSGNHCAACASPCLPSVPGFVTSENNFGNYGNINPDHACMASSSATTNFWFR